MALYYKSIKQAKSHPDQSALSQARNNASNKYLFYNCINASYSTVAILSIPPRLSPNVARQTLDLVMQYRMQPATHIVTSFLSCVAGGDCDAALYDGLENY